MVIGVDASRAVKQTKTGTEHYSWQLLRELVQIPSHHTFRLYAPFLPKDTFPPDRCEWKIIPERRLWSQIGLAKEIKADPPDVLFVPSHVIPLLSNVPSVVTIHDLAYKYYPRAYSSFDRRYLEFTTGVSISKAKKVIVPSLLTAKDIQKYYQVDTEKIVVIPHGYNAEIFKPLPRSGSPYQFPYVFFVGRIETKKNVLRLIDAFELLSKQEKNLHLVLAGKPGWGSEDVEAKIKSLAENVKQRIHLIGYIDDYDVARHLAHAKAFVFPSLYEGFGMPVLEAMAVGCPVICSDAPALVEIGKDAAIILPPDNSLSWAAAIQRVIDNPNLATEMREKGFKRASQYSWRKAAEKTLEVLNNVGA
jgi:glycosyltransferase involved in cell wall biosynthesis